MQLASSAVDLSPEDGDYWNTLGIARYRSGDWQGSVSALTRSLRLMGNRNESFNTLLLAMAYWQLGEQEQARIWHKRGIRWMEENQPANEELRLFRREAEELLGIRAKQSAIDRPR